MLLFLFFVPWSTGRGVSMEGRGEGSGREGSLLPESIGALWEIEKKLKDMPVSSRYVQKEGSRAVLSLKHTDTHLLS